MLRKTKIICTLGPAVDSEDMIVALIKGGMNGARFNFSHGSHPEHLERLNRLKAIRDRMGSPVATILDTKGPEIRIRSFESKTVDLTAGETFTLTVEDVPGTARRVSVTYPRLHEEVIPGQEILIDDGLVAMRVREIQGFDIICEVENGGTLSANKSINIPGARIQLPALTEKDVADIRFGVENDFDFIAASFVRRPADVEAVRQVLHDCGGDQVKIIAKIENQEGIDNLDGILEAADGVMVARGDLGVEIPAAKVPALQKQMIRKGLQAGKPVITATQMLDSMMRNPRPTRAEVSDVANAVYDGTSCVMLSGETAGGKYPVEALAAMLEIVTEAEGSIDYWKRFQKQLVITTSNNINDAITHTCCLGHPGRQQLRPDGPDDLPLPPRLPGGGADHARKDPAAAVHLLGRDSLPHRRSELHGPDFLPLRRGGGEGGAGPARGHGGYYRRGAPGAERVHEPHQGPGD